MITLLKIAIFSSALKREWQPAFDTMRGMSAGIVKQEAGGSVVNATLGVAKMRVLLAVMIDVGEGDVNAFTAGNDLHAAVRNYQYLSSV